jgi:hypothetical protein
MFNLGRHIPQLFGNYFVVDSQKKATYQFAHWLFGRALGLVSVIAFLSYWSQADALIGDDGIKPWKEDLQFIEELTAVQENPAKKWSLRPTLLWIQPLANHHMLFALGTISAVFLTMGVFPFASAIVSYVCYLSLMVVGEPFLSFQWDILLTETLLLSLFFLPIIRFHHFLKPLKVSNFGRLLLLGILAKLMLESGLVKFTYFAGDGTNTWRDLTALNFHYWTQPLPHSWSPWIHSLPAWFDRISLYWMYAVELLLPFFLFVPGRLRRVGLFGQILLQGIIMASGNYGFFNLLTLCLCIPLVDDQMLPDRLSKRLTTPQKELQSGKSYLKICLIALTSFLFASTTLVHLINDSRGNQPAEKSSFVLPAWVLRMQEQIRIFRSFNSYGLFRVMTTTRPEIIIEGSKDGKAWQTYQFAWKPSRENQPLHFTGPHMPRIDWQMWFEGLNFENYSGHPFSRFLYERFLQMKVEGKENSFFSNLAEVLGQKEFQALQQAPPEIQKQAISNYNQMMQTFMNRSSWFGSLLHAMGKDRSCVLEKLSDSNPINFKPSFLRVSLYHFSFSEEKNKVWETEKIPGASFVLTVPNDF